MEERELLLVVLAGLLIGAVIVAVEVPRDRPYVPEPLTVSLTNMTVIWVDVNDAEWMKGTLFDWDPLHAYAYDFWIILEPC